jgi:hypothetical protein
MHSAGRREKHLGQYSGLRLHWGDELGASLGASSPSTTAGRLGTSWGKLLLDWPLGVVDGTPLGEAVGVELTRPSAGKGLGGDMFLKPDLVTAAAKETLISRRGVDSITILSGSAISFSSRGKSSSRAWVWMCTFAPSSDVAFR